MRGNARFNAVIREQGPPLLHTATRVRAGAVALLALAATACGSESEVRDTAQQLEVSSTSEPAVNDATAEECYNCFHIGDADEEQWTLAKAEEVKYCVLDLQNYCATPCGEGRDLCEPEADHALLCGDKPSEQDCDTRPLQDVLRSAAAKRCYAELGESRCVDGLSHDGDCGIVSGQVHESSWRCEVN